MKILVISSILPLPGLRNTNDFIFQIYNNYRRQFPGDTIVIATPVKFDLNPINTWKRRTLRGGIKKPLRSELDGFQVEILSFLSAWRFRNLHALITRSVYYFNMRRIRRLFSEHSFDLIHARYIFSDGLLAYMLSRRYGIPYLINTHNERFYFEHIISRFIAVNVLQKASKVLPLNHSNYVYFKSIGINNIERSTHGFNNHFIKKQKRTTNKQVSILSVCELIRLKNIDKVIQAISGLISRYDLTYTIIGSGPEKENLKLLVNSNHLTDRVFFKDYIPHDQIADEMYKHDVFIMPSYFETFGRVYFEAMAMGIPIICAKNSGIYGIFKDGEEGLAVDHNSIDEIAEALEKLISSDEERLRIGKSGQDLVKNFTWERIASDLHKKYNSILMN